MPVSKGAKGSDVNQGKSANGFSDDDLRDVESAYTPTDIINRPTGNDFWNIYNVERCGI